MEQKRTVQKNFRTSEKVNKMLKTTLKTHPNASEADIINKALEEYLQNQASKSMLEKTPISKKIVDLQYVEDKDRIIVDGKHLVARLSRIIAAIDKAKETEKELYIKNPDAFVNDKDPNDDASYLFFAYAINSGISINMEGWEGMSDE